MNENGQQLPISHFIGFYGFLVKKINLIKFNKLN